MTVHTDLWVMVNTSSGLSGNRRRWTDPARIRRMPRRGPVRRGSAE